MPVTHAKISAIANNPANPGLVQPSEWNAAHVIDTLGTPAADGIAFPAVPVANAGASVLDAYSEGLWTPTVSFVTPGDFAATYGRQTGRYTRIGRLVVCHIDLTTTAMTFTTAAGDFVIIGLPFTSSALVGGYAGPLVMRIPGAPSPITGIAGLVDSAATTAKIIMARTTAGVINVNTGHMTTGTNIDIRGTFIYHV